MAEARKVPRREFVRTVSVSSALAAATSLAGCATAGGTAVVPALPGSGSSSWDMSWLDRLTAPHRVVFNVTERNEIGLMQAGMLMDGHAAAEGLTDKDLNVVLVFRHQAVGLLVADDVWSELGYGSTPTAGGNPHRRDKSAPNEAATLPELQRRGAILIACNIALRGTISRLKEKRGLSQEEAERVTKRSLIPGSYIMPNGVYAVARAQSAGCGYFRPG